MNEQNQTAAAGVVEFLSSHDATCPRCGYNLRGASRARCTECGLNLRLTVEAETSVHREGWMHATLYLLIAGMLASLASQGWSMYQAMQFGGMFSPAIWVSLSVLAVFYVVTTMFAVRAVVKLRASRGKSAEVARAAHASAVRAVLFFAGAYGAITVLGAVVSLVFRLW